VSTLQLSPDDRQAGETRVCLLRLDATREAKPAKAYQMTLDGEAIRRCEMREMPSLNNAERSNVRSEADVATNFALASHSRILLGVGRWWWYGVRERQGPVLARSLTRRTYRTSPRSKSSREATKSHPFAVTVMNQCCRGEERRWCLLPLPCAVPLPPPWLLPTV